MTSKEARRLLPGTVVRSNLSLGTVRKLSCTAIFIDWANGQRGWIDYNDAKKISLW